MIIFLASRLGKRKAGTLEKLAGSVAQLAEEPFKKLMINEENRQFLLFDKSQNNQPVEITLKDRLGAGYFGSVYVVDDLKGLPVELQNSRELSQEENLELVAKFPHALKLFALRFPLLLAEKENRTELKIYRRILSLLGDFQKDELYPKDPAWGAEGMPIVPIVGSMKTRRGTIIMKPKVLPGAIFLKDMGEIFRHNGGKLPPDMVQGLRDVYDFVQAVYSVDRFSADIRPTNFVYILDPANLKLFGYKKPGFLVFEFSKVPFNKRQYISPKMTFEGYLEEFESYLKRQAPVNS